VYGLDYLGQGISWPIDCDDGYAPSEQGLRYCAETWMQQIIGFIEDVVPQKKVHLVGNSVGGYLAVFVAAQRPDLIESVVLLNATPVWGLNLPFWSGHLPAPRIPKAIGRLLFDRIRDESTIRQFLAATYANAAAYDDMLVRQVQSCTENKGGHAAFASILWSPPLEVDNKGFYDCLKQIQGDVLLCFGSDDPWCKPAFGRRMLQMLQQRSAGCHAYLELSAVGHCPNHEAPRATASVISSWLNGNREFASTRVNEAWGDTNISPKTVDEIQVSLMDNLSAMIL
jgi:pimeloyl-ACP methyl ester carboxylesterase